MEEAVRLILALWTHRRTIFHARYFHAEDAILEPKPFQKPRPLVMIAGGGEQLTLRAVARLADACNVGGDPEMVRRKLEMLRGHWISRQLISASESCVANPRNPPPTGRWAPQQPLSNPRLSGVSRPCRRLQADDWVRPFSRICY
jgi:hypothetical protein